MTHWETAGEQSRYTKVMGNPTAVILISMSVANGRRDDGGSLVGYRVLEHLWLPSAGDLAAVLDRKNRHAQTARFYRRTEKPLEKGKPSIATHGARN